MIFDTITAIATPIGEGGIGIIRISGEKTFEIAQKIFISSKGENWFKGSHYLHYGKIKNFEGNVIDEVLLSVMLAPNTYTKEDVVEINCHGGIISVKEILKTVLSCGARLAYPGEFTKRAFLNGRLDLAQAESVIDIIKAKTDSSLKVAVNQLKGTLSQKVDGINEDILNMLAELEAAIDFPEDEIEESTIEEIKNKTQEIIRELEYLVNNGDTGKIYREGIQTIIIGQPNVGKSSLLNALLREERAIVTDIPGTTRDLIEEMYTVRGIPLKLIDTAGLRETCDLVEKIGLEKTKLKMEDADLVLLMLDATKGISQKEKEIIKSCQHKKILIIINKIDLLKAPFTLKNSEKIPTVNISALTGEGIENLEDEIEKIVLAGKSSSSQEIIVSNVRHQMAIQKALIFMQAFKEAIENNLTPDLSSLELRSAWEAIGEITGSSITENLLDRIFENFCIGK